MAYDYRPIGDIPIKFASRETAATREFRDKWVGKDAAIVISSLWHGSGVPQKRLALFLHLIAAAPLMSDVLIVMQADKSSLECARELLAASEKSTVVFDSTATFDAMYPPDSFEWEGDMSDSSRTSGAVIRYTGPAELVPPIVTDAYVMSLISAAEDKICHLESDSDDYKWRRQEKLDPFTAKRYIDALSCGLIHIPSRTELGIEKPAPADVVLFQDILSKISTHRNLGRYDFELPVPANVSEYMKAVDKAKQSAGAVRKIWERALTCTPFALVTDREGLDEFVHNMDSSAVKAVAESTGAYQMIDAYMSGVPLEDILA